MHNFFVATYILARQRVLAAAEQPERGEGGPLSYALIAAAVVGLGAIVVTAVTAAVQSRVGQIR